MLLASVCLLAFAFTGTAGTEEVLTLLDHSKIVETVEVQKEEGSQPILFVGDIMLGRNVEHEMSVRGVEYPYALISDFLLKYPYVVGNFEAVVPARHTPTPSLTFQFSVATSAVATLQKNGFTHMTLANNHAYDYGKAGYTHTRVALSEAGVVTGGSPERVTVDHVLFVDAEGMRVALVPIYAVFADPDNASLKKAFAFASAS